MVVSVMTVTCLYPWWHCLGRDCHSLCFAARFYQESSRIPQLKVTLVRPLLSWYYY